jgi:Leucine-rich repeat (LRR) protein
MTTDSAEMREAVGTSAPSPSEPSPSGGKRQRKSHTHSRTASVLSTSISEKAIARRIEFAKGSGVLDLSRGVDDPPLGLWPTLKPSTSLAKVTSFMMERQALRIVPLHAFRPMKRLVLLSLRHNMLNKLPKDLGLLVHLRRLYVEHNKLTTLPSSLATLPHLEELRADNNNLTAFPREVVVANNRLVVLTLTHNPNIGAAPPELVGSLSHLLLFAADPHTDAAISSSGPDVHSPGAFVSASSKSKAALPDLCMLFAHHHDARSGGDEKFALQYLSDNKLRVKSRAIELARSAETAAYEEIKMRAKARLKSQGTHAESKVQTTNATHGHGRQRHKLHH